MLDLSQAVAAAVHDLDPLATLFIVATKSGTTTEPLAGSPETATIRQSS